MKMKNKTLILIASAWMTVVMAASAHPTVAGRVKSYSNGVLTIEMDDKSTKKLIISKQTTVKYRGASSLASVPVGAKVSIEVIGSVIANPAKAGKIVDWSNSSEIVAVGAKAPYHTPVGAYAASNGTGGIPDGAPVGQHAASHTLAAVAHGGAINAPTQETHSVAPTASPDQNAHSSMGQAPHSNQYMNQGESTSGPLEMIGVNPYGSTQPTSTGAQPSYEGGPQQNASNAGMYGADQAGMYPQDPALGMNPAAQPGMDPSMYGVDPSAGMSNPYAASNLGMGQSANLMGLTGDEDGEYSAGGDMMGLNDSAYGDSGNKITGSILQVDMKRGFLTIQSFTNPQPQKILMGPGSNASPDLLIPGKMVEITGRPTAQGFQAMDIHAAPGF